MRQVVCMFEKTDHYALVRLIVFVQAYTVSLVV